MYFAHPGAGQAIRQGVEHRIVDTIAGEIVTCIQRNIKDHKQAQYR